jgi:1-deoxy-D-xylulose-5-phosphate reductoisomerase
MLLLYDSYEMYENVPAAKRIAILGSTGSIGQQTLDVIRAHPDKFKVIALTAGNNLDLLRRQIAEFQPSMYYHGSSAKIMTDGTSHYMPQEDIVCHSDVDIVVAATAGTAGLKPLLAAIKGRKIVALANKEPLVMAGALVLSEMKKGGGWILPVDSEHSAIWQCLNGENDKPAKILLTASGGPFRNFSRQQLDEVTPEQALQHPSWKMGRKVTIDSATLMNKGLEVIEARWLFDVTIDQIEILIHPQSIVHSMVVLADGSIKAQLSYPDMRLPIQYALSYPERIANENLPKLDWSKVNCLEFGYPDLASFPCLSLALEAGRKGGTYPAVLCGADEIAVELFLNHKIRFTGIAELIEKTLALHKCPENPDLADILSAEEWARERALSLAGGIK